MTRFSSLLLFLSVFGLMSAVMAQEVPPLQYGVYNYTGEQSNGKKSGQGSVIWPSGDRYVGGFLDDTMYGIGTMYYADSNRYEGDWKDGVQNGHGKFIWKNGDVYEGNFKDNLMDGEPRVWVALRSTGPESSVGQECPLDPHPSWLSRRSTPSLSPGQHITGVVPPMSSSQSNRRSHPVRDLSPQIATVRAWNWKVQRAVLVRATLLRGRARAPIAGPTEIST